ncbi:hypothetical protein SporoP8_02805 [Sporosarcina ureae]|nr:hypothetical protein SporoP8_02805 [Sporosarcina ureae]
MGKNTQWKDVYVQGTSTTKWGFFPDVSASSMGSEAIVNALRDARTKWGEVEAVFAGSVYQGTASGHRVVGEIGFTGIPIVNVENACSSGATAFRLAYDSIRLGQYETVLAIGFEKMPRGPIPSTAFPGWQLAMGFNVQPANYALETMEYMRQYGATVEDFARVSVKNRRNGSLNPNARFQKEVSAEEVLQSAMIASPLRLLNCCPLADGAVAMVLTSKPESNRAIHVASSVLVSGVYGEESYQSGITASVQHYPSEGIVEKSARQAFEMAGYGPKDIDVVQAYDSMGPGELWDIEKLGFCARGTAPELLREGVFDLMGRLPVNTDGGLLSRGHPLGATALAQIHELVLQLRGEAGHRQVADPKLGLAHAMGAGPNSAVTILQR